MFSELRQPLPLLVDGKGSGLAFGVIDYGLESDLIWVVILDAGGEIWCAPNAKVRAQANWTAGRVAQEKPRPDACDTSDRGEGVPPTPGGSPDHHHETSPA